MKPLPAVSDPFAPRPAAIYAGLLQMAEDLPSEDLPGFFAELERARWIARLRLEVAGRGAAQDSAPKPLLAVEQVAALLGGISEGQVYRMAKGVLRSAAVDVGEGTLRFDPVQIERFIEARRRG